MKSFTATKTATAAPTARTLPVGVHLGQQSSNTPTVMAALPTLDDTYTLLVEAARSVCSLRLRFGSQMPWGTTKKAALQEVASGIASPVDSPVYKQHERNWAKLVKMERIHLMSRNTCGCFYLPGFLLTKNSSGWIVNQEAVAHFVPAGVGGQVS